MQTRLCHKQQAHLKAEGPFPVQQMTCAAARAGPAHCTLPGHVLYVTQLACTLRAQHTALCMAQVSKASVTLSSVMQVLAQVLGAAEHHAEHPAVRGLDYLDSDNPMQVPPNYCAHVAVQCIILYQGS